MGTSNAGSSDAASSYAEVFWLLSWRLKIAIAAFVLAKVHGLMGAFAVLGCFGNPALRPLAKYCIVVAIIGVVTSIVFALWEGRRLAGQSSCSSQTRLLG